MIRNVWARIGASGDGLRCRLKNPFKRAVGDKPEILQHFYPTASITTHRGQGARCQCPPSLSGQRRSSANRIYPARL